MENTFLIGEVSKLFQLDIRTLRYYDTIDLFKPKYIDQTNGYRYYTVDQFEQLNTILYLKSLHIPLKRIKQFLNNRDVNNILNLLEEQQTETTRRLDEILQVQQKIKNRIQQIKDATNPEPLHKITENQLPERTIVYLKQTIAPHHSLEMSIRLLENSANMKSAVFLGKVGLSISKENLLKRHFEAYNSIFIIIDVDTYTYFHSKTLPMGKYLTLRFEGTHEDATSHYHKLMDYIKQNNYEILDDALEITLIDYGFTNDKSKFVTEIQILVK